MFYKWARAQHLTDDDPTEAIERPRQKVPLPRPIHDTDLQIALLFAQEGRYADPRIEAALLLGAVSGLRCCELARLRWEDIEAGQARVIGKGSTERVVPLNAETLAAWIGSTARAGSSSTGGRSSSRAIRGCAPRGN